MESIEVKFDLRRSKSVNSVTEFQHILWEVKFKHKFYFVVLEHSKTSNPRSLGSRF